MSQNLQPRQSANHLPDNLPAPIPTEQGSSLDERKKQLEIEKLEQEIQFAKADQKWWRKSVRDVKLSEWLTAAVALVTVIVVFSTGYFNASRERLAAQGDRLHVEKLEMEGKRDRLSSEIVVKEAELQELKSKVQPFEKENAALLSLRQLNDPGRFYVEISSDWVSS